MKVLVFGAGVIGCYLTHVLCDAGHDVTLLACGAWKETLETQGLKLRHMFYRPGFRRFVMRILYFIMAKSAIGDLIACNHCRNTVAEMEMLDRDFTALLEQDGVPSMPVWNVLKSQMPSWEEVHQTYDKMRTEKR